MSIMLSLTEFLSQELLAKPIYELVSWVQRTWSGKFKENLIFLILEVYEWLTFPIVLSLLDSLA